MYRIPLPCGADAGAAPVRTAEEPAFWPALVGPGLLGLERTTDWNHDPCHGKGLSVTYAEVDANPSRAGQRAGAAEGGHM